MGLFVVERDKAHTAPYLIELCSCLSDIEHQVITKDMYDRLVYTAATVNKVIISVVSC